MPLARHFLCHLLRLISRFKGKKDACLTKEVAADSRLWQKFLKMFNAVTSINNVVWQQPDNACIADSYKHVICGFSLRTGQAFRFEIPPRLQFRVGNNAIECLAEIVEIWIGIIEDELVEHYCAFSGTCNTSSIGWTHKSNFCDSTKKPNLMFSRNLEDLIIDNKVCLCTQRFKG